MATRMAHPKHGFTHAYNNNDIAYLEKLGWHVEESAVPQPYVDSEGRTYNIGEDKSLRAAYLEKFGKKPHHMMKLENLRKALNDDSE